MERIELDLRRLTSVANLHQHLYKVLALPKYYGCNLDALHDCLTERAEATELVISARVTEEKYLGAYGEALLQVLQDAAEENPSLKVIIK